MTQNPGFPAMKWHPQTGEATVFNKSQDVPDGYLDEHPDNLSGTARAEAVAAAAVKPPASDELCLTREEIMAELHESGLSYKKNTPTKALYDMLVEALKEYLAENEVEFPADADAKALLALVPKPE